MTDYLRAMSAVGQSKSWVRSVGWLLLAVAIFAVQVVQLQRTDASAPPPVGDVAEVFNLGWSMSHGGGYRFDWDDPACRALWARYDRVGDLRIFTARRGRHPTLFRPPLMPLALAGVLAFRPAEPFLDWKLIDAALFSGAATLLIHGVLHGFGWQAALLMLPLLLLDPLRLTFVPGMWTEGIAFDAVAVLTWLLLREPRGGAGWVLVGGGTLGLLCLDRSFFVPLLPLLSGVLVLSLRVGRRRRWGLAVAVLAVAMAAQLPWWVRNVWAAHRFVPLGTQGGFNLPDEYSDEAVQMHGLWTGREMTRLWAATAITPAQRAARARPAVLALWPGEPDFAALIHAVDCESLSTELAVADLGQHAAATWIRWHKRLLPRLFVDKLITQTIDHRGSLTAVALLGTAALLASPPRRRAALRLALLVAVYAVGIGITHAVVGRFLVPVLPPLYALAAAGAGEGLRRLLSPG